MNRVNGMPPIGKVDHDIVYVEYDIKAKRIKQASRKIYLYNRADMVGLKDHMTQFKDEYLSEDHSHMSINDMWVKFKTGFVDNQTDIIEAFNSTFRYLDDLLNIDNPYFEQMVGQIYPTELQLNKANSSDTEAPFLDLNLSITNGIVSPKIYDKRDDFNFEIVN